MPVETKCSECGGKKLEPDPTARTMDERFAFERAWDAKFMRGIRPKQVSDGWPEARDA